MGIHCKILNWGMTSYPRVLADGVEVKLEGGGHDKHPLNMESDGYMVMLYSDDH